MAKQSMIHIFGGVVRVIESLLGVLVVTKSCHRLQTADVAPDNSVIRALKLKITDVLRENVGVV